MRAWAWLLVPMAACNVPRGSGVTRNLLRKFYLETSGFDGETRVLAHGR